MAKHTDLAQKVAAAKAKAARLQHQLNKQKRSVENHRKFVIGGAMLAAIRDDADFRARFAAKLRHHVREVEKPAVADLMEEGSPDGTAFRREGDRPEGG